MKEVYIDTRNVKDKRRDGTAEHPFLSIREYFDSLEKEITESHNVHFRAPSDFPDKSDISNPPTSKVPKGMTITIHGENEENDCKTSK